MATYNFELNNKPNRKGTYSVLFRITENKKHKRIKTSVELESPKHWNPQAQEVRKSEPNFKIYNHILKRMKDEASKAEQELEANKNTIVETLRNYKIEIVRIKATIGPTVTLYEIVPAPGIKIAKIKSLEDDIALALSALGVRIIAPIPGAGTIGIEVPNRHSEVVSMRSIIASKKFQESSYALPVA